MKVTVRGVLVNVQIWNEQATNTVVMLHGFTGSTKTWEPIVSRFSNEIKVLAIDLIGHGATESPKSIGKYSMEEQVNLLEELFLHFNLNNFTLVGYSMGGRVALSYVAAFPERVKNLILESASPGLKTEEERSNRRKSDEELANKIEQFGIPAFVEKWENIPLFASQKTLPSKVQQAIREERLAQIEIGLANSLRGMGTGSQKSLWSVLNQIQIPVTLITGTMDEKFCNIAIEMKTNLPEANHILVEDAGHAIHVENPMQFATIVEDVLKN